MVKSDEKASVAAKARPKNLDKITVGFKHIRSKLNERKYKKHTYVQEQIDKLFTAKRNTEFFEYRTHRGRWFNWSFNEKALAQEKERRAQ